MKIEIPIWEKSNLTIQEAAAYFGIGMQKLRQLTAKEDFFFTESSFELSSCSLLRNSSNEFA